MNKSPQCNQQKLRKYVFTKTWKVAVTASISEKKNVFHVRKNSKQAKSAFMFTTMQSR